MGRGESVCAMNGQIRLRRKLITADSQSSDSPAIYVDRDRTKNGEITRDLHRRVYIVAVACAEG